MLLLVQYQQKILSTMRRKIPCVWFCFTHLNSTVTFQGKIRKACNYLAMFWRDNLHLEETMRNKIIRNNNNKKPVFHSFSSPYSPTQFPLSWAESYRFCFHKLCKDYLKYKTLLFFLVPFNMKWVSCLDQFLTGRAHMVFLKIIHGWYQPWLSASLRCRLSQVCLQSSVLLFYVFMGYWSSLKNLCSCTQDLTMSSLSGQEQNSAVAYSISRQKRYRAPK